jgi:hypothetical protein
MVADLNIYIGLSKEDKIRVLYNYKDKEGKWF